ncbi:MAG: hypothetical protein DMF59_17855 [Acidobacteria bacterium]|nr:MAG: hypothetical protein DMF59_17855 [Acidobacteriota bacterium]
MRALRAVAIVITLLATIYAIDVWVVLPYECNLNVKRGMKRITSFESLPQGSLEAVRLARLTADELEPCVLRTGSNIGADMVLAASYRVVGQPRRALEVYELALEYDRRPELYFNLGQVQAELGDQLSAVRNFTTACLYDPEYFDVISKEQPEVRNAVRAYLQANTPQ